MFIALAATLAAAAVSAERTVVIDGKQIGFTAAAQSASAPLRIALLLSSEERALLATLIHRAWTPRDPAAVAAYPEPAALLGGRAPDPEPEQPGARHDERPP